MVDSFGGIMQLPIRRRGNFLKDDFFKGFQHDFDSAIQDIMDRHSGRSLLADQFSNYRKLRENAEESGPVASISETKESTVIVLDMSEFIKGSISVRTRGYYAIVEADYKEKTFHRKFSLPRCTNIEGVKSAMSNEGILTVTAPKRISEVPAKKPNGACLKIDIGEPEKEGDKTSTASPSEETKTSSTVASEKERSNSPPTPSGEDRVLSIAKQGKFFEDHYFKNVWKDFENAMDEMVQREERKKKAASEQKSQQEEKEIADRLKNEMLLEAEKKQQEFFHKAQQRESEPSLRIPKFTRLNSYRNLRSWAPDTETQAATITQDDNGYKIVMDVKNCSNGDGDLSVKATEGSLNVCGRRGSLSFKKEFTLKGLCNPDQVNASVSEDGILTVTVRTS